MGNPEIARKFKYWYLFRFLKFFKNVNLSAFRKCELQALVTEFGVEVSSNDTNVRIIKKIERSPDYHLKSST